MQTSEDVGGSGGGSAGTTTRDVRLLARALAESWDIPEDTRHAMLARLGQVVADPNSKLRAVLSASKTLFSLSRIKLQGRSIHRNMRHLPVDSSQLNARHERLTTANPRTLEGGTRTLRRWVPGPLLSAPSLPDPLLPWTDAATIAETNKGPIWTFVRCHVSAITYGIDGARLWLSGPSG